MDDSDLTTAIKAYPRSSPLPPTSIPRPFNTYLPEEYTSPTALRLPTTWRCGTCTSLRPVLSLLSTTTTTITTDSSCCCCCALPSLQAVYDQFGALYLFWRDDPAVSDLRVPSMLEEARWRVWRAGGGEWEDVLLRAEQAASPGQVERERGQEREEGSLKGGGLLREGVIGRRWSYLS
ncbi:hypothetical protein N657DRAFT_678814 [Parathielavia appendiculata]|uniref:Uncharacterized protein n=1 Tax=Parathielavia appendiculata TaxID=2587402 RepID=A0AAN6U3H3_9PEZI|nr:hypothetical protein N657DRAFT_678814 [Parathielavia appendiculata]